jgi:phenylalanine-4-hydroxylase
MKEYKAYMPDENGYIHYSTDEDETWQILYDRQIELIKGRAVDEHFTGLNKLNLTRNKIPQPIDVSNALRDITGWAVEPVPALIDFDTFFGLLAQKRFPAASFIRRREDLDYLKEPDIFHELFGHCPMLTQPDFADFVQEVGKAGKHLEKPDQIMLGRLFWFTVEFGLINTADGLRIYGAGILSSKTESVYALESSTPKRKPFELTEALRTTYRYDELQKTYFIINSYAELYHMIDGKILDAFAKARALGMLPNQYAPKELTYETIETITTC